MTGCSQREVAGIKNLLLALTLFASYPVAVTAQADALYVGIGIYLSVYFNSGIGYITDAFDMQISDQLIMGKRLCHVNQ